VILAWKPIAAGIAALLIIAACWRIHDAIWQAGYDARTAQAAAEVQRKLHDANLADDASRRCAADPACRLSNDGYRRD